MIQKDLKIYIQEKILPIYQKNDWSHQKWHIYQVIEKSLKIANNLEVDKNMVYTIAAFHDIACFKGRENHEKNSAKMLKEDKKLRDFFSEEQIEIMANATVDHRASLEYIPRSIYGKIVSTADRFTNIKSLLRSTHSYALEFYPELSLEEMFQMSYDYIEKKYGPKGYGKVYFLKEEYEEFQKEIAYYLKHIYEFKKIFYEVDAFLRKIYHLPKINYPYIKRYLSVDDFYKQKFHTKVFKVSLNAGMSCPHKEKGIGCIFCSNESGDFAGKKEDDLITQFNKIKKEMQKKWKSGKFIAYFQAGTNTYAPLNILKEKYESVINLPDVIGLSIATRSDAITKETLDYLEVLNKKTFLTVELGLQSIHEKTLKWIHRGHTLENFENMVYELKKRKINTVVHIINGLPTETEKEMLETVKYLNQLPIDGIKIHMLQILKNTPLEKIYKEQRLPLLTKQEYVRIVCKQLELLNPNIVIHRLTGDPKKEDLIEPSWVLKKFVVLNDINKTLEENDSYQGKLSC